MAFRKTAASMGMLAGVMTLGGCGGDGASSVASANTTPASNSSLAKLVASQSFANDGASQTAAFDLVTGNTTAGSSTAKPLTISYDATSNSYTITTQGRSQTFAPADMASAANGIAVYSKTSGTTTDRLTMLAANVTGYNSAAPQYSGLAYWQRYSVSGTGEATTFDIFTYGLDTPASAVPRTGQAAYATTVVGLVTLPGTEARMFQGTGRLDVDFLDGILSTSATTTETGLASGAVIGGTGSLTGTGTLSSSANAFTGTVHYSGSGNSSSGTLSGRFYGPSAQELGAAFSSSGSDGSAASGAIWGIASPGTTPINLSVANPATDQTYAAAAAELDSTPSTGSSTSLGTNPLAVTTAGDVTIGGGSSYLAQTTLANSDRVAATDTNFTSFQKTVNGATVALDMYRPGNSELALTYMSFGRWRETPDAAAQGTSIYTYFVYGLTTDAATLAARTGTAHYAGVAYGTAFDSGTGTGNAVKGASAFDIDFNIGGYAGTIALKSSSTDYGTFNASGTLSSGMPAQGSLTGTKGGTGQITPSFYGPAAQEFGGPFRISISGSGSATTTIVGATVTKAN
ncbi:transferrin-binding protein-like solute binding protein [Novosphingobium nitrogenifigens]|uniref:transferrin-binding protein-like solute binding protein n=2 Tax=Novosphingobium nitrogenifigens TaxID=378548 RepID=UPI000AEC8962|nr:transferrin-binding protein-like solute binding protein [Novosphingobium nitrogenifigens]